MKVLNEGTPWQTKEPFVLGILEWAYGGYHPWNLSWREAELKMMRSKRNLLNFVLASATFGTLQATTWSYPLPSGALGVSKHLQLVYFMVPTSHTVMMTSLKWSYPLRLFRLAILFGWIPAIPPPNFESKTNPYKRAFCKLCKESSSVILRILRGVYPLANQQGRWKLRLQALLVR